MKPNNNKKVLDIADTVVAWFITGLLFFLGVGTLPVAASSSTSLANYSPQFYYFLLAAIICPKTPLPEYQKLLLVFVAFLFGIWTGLL